MGLKTSRKYILASAVAALAPVNAMATIAGFGSFATINYVGPSSSSIGYSSDGTTFTLTDGQQSEAVTGFSTVPQDITSFDATFTYTVPGGNNVHSQYSQADGFTFIIQDDSRGTSALGGGGGSKGYGSSNTITPSIAIGYEMYGGQTSTYYANGTSTTSNSIGNINALNDGNPIQVSINYTGTTLSASYYDTGTKLAYYQTITGVNLPSIVGSNSALIGFGAGTGGAASSQNIKNFTFTPTSPLTYAPVSLLASSFNQDMVIEATAPSTGAAANITATMDAGTAKTGSTFYEEGYNTAAPTTGLPPSGSVFTSQADSRHVFQMQNYSGNNALLLTSTSTSGTMTFATPAAYQSLSFLVSTGHGPAPFDITINYSDNAPSTLIPYDALSPDWFFNGPDAWDAQGRGYASAAGATTYDNINNNEPGMYQLDVMLPDGTDPISSVTLNYDGGNSQTDLAIFGISGAVPEPTSVGLLIAGGMALTARRRNRRA